MCARRTARKINDNVDHAAVLETSKKSGTFMGQLRDCLSYCLHLSPEVSAVDRNLRIALLDLWKSIHHQQQA